MNTLPIVLVWLSLASALAIVVLLVDVRFLSCRRRSLDRARELGREAAQSGRYFHNNPFGFGTEERMEWERARLARMDEILRKNNPTPAAGVSMAAINKELKK